VNGILPILDISQDEFCDTGRVVFQDYSLDGADSITNRVWNFGDGSAPVSGSADNVSHFYSQPGTYYITETLNTARGCTNTITDTIRVFRTPDPVIMGPGDICVGNVVQFNASTVVPDSAINWRWSYGNGETSTLPTITGRFNEPGVATVTLLASNELGCTPADNLSCSNCATPYANPRFTTKYNISVVDSNGCRATSSIVVRVICENRNYFVPNTFSPNNDGQNDVFYPRGNGLDRIQSMRIFNRWGELVFERKNFVPNSAAEGWNGMIRGKPAASDAYVYVIEVICDNAQIVQIKGNVTLIR
jgi:gliding motility-associated-like protein